MYIKHFNIKICQCTHRSAHGTAHTHSHTFPLCLRSFRCMAHDIIKELLGLGPGRAAALCGSAVFVSGWGEWSQSSSAAVCARCVPSLEALVLGRAASHAGCSRAESGRERREGRVGRERLWVNAAPPDNRPPKGRASFLPHSNKLLLKTAEMAFWRKPLKKSLWVKTCSLRWLSHREGKAANS